MNLEGEVWIIEEFCHKDLCVHFSSILLRLNITSKILSLVFHMKKQDQNAFKSTKTSVGRPTSLESEKIDQSIIDAVLSIWIQPEDELSFTEIHLGLVRKGVVQNKEYRYKTNRILKKLHKMKLIEKIGRGRYCLKVEPDEFRVFDYLQTLRQKCEITKFRVGGSLWTLSQLYLLGMPESVLKYRDAKYALEVLNVRIAQMFETLRVLAKEVKKMERAAVEKKLLPLPPCVLRELLLELIPYYLGCKAGMDFDGLPLDELNMVLPKMIQSLPEEVTDQSPTRKKIMMKCYLIINKLMNQQEDKQGHYEKKFINEEDEDFALVVIRPEHLIDESGFEKRRVKLEIVNCSLENKSALHTASCLLHFDKENVLAVLDVHGRKYLGKQKWKETKALYERLYASNWVARIISDFEFYDKKEKVEAKGYIQKLTDEHGVKTIIKYLPFSHCTLNFILPTPRKESILQKFFPQISSEKIHEWLNEGAIVASKIGEEKLNDVRKKLENIKE